MGTKKTAQTTSSKMVTDRQKNAADLGAVLDRHAEEANATFATLVEPYLQEGEHPPDLLFLQEILRRRLAGLKLGLVAADDTTLRERKDDRGHRRLRDAAVAQVANLLSRLRSGVDATYGPGASALALAIEGPVPRDPVVLHRLGSRVLELLRQDPFVDLEPQVRGFLVDPVAWIEDLEEPVYRLGTSLETLTQESRDTITSLIQKQQAMRRYDVAYRSLIQVMEGLFRHTGLEELAETVRPTQRRRQPQEEQPQMEDQGQTVAEPPSEPATAAWPELRILDGGGQRRSELLQDLDLRPRARERDPTTS